jgi:outer membrane protein assembly factor BamB
MIAAALALALATPGLATRLPPAPIRLFDVAWQRTFVRSELLEYRPLEAGGAAIDPASGVAIFGTRDGWIHAVRPDGVVAWEVKAGGGFTAPPFVEGDTVYLGSSDGRLYALSVANGRERWHYDAKEELGTRPVVQGGTVFVASLQDTLFAVDKVSGAWKWHHRRETRTGFTIRGAASAIAANDVVYAAYSDGFAVALDAGTGRVRWERQIAPPGDYVDVDALRLDGSRLYAAAYSGAVLALDAATGNTVWTFQAPGASRLTVGGGLVVAVTANTVYALGSANGQPTWSAPLGGGPGADPVLAGRWVLVPAVSGGLRFLEAASGRTLRVFDPGTGVTAAPAVLSGRVYVLSNAGALIALDLS